ncbi:hypothetical protein [Chelativorans sp.]|nr:hypothetical protein [Chelativorans sp.]
MIRDFEALKGKKWEEATEEERRDWIEARAELMQILNPPFDPSKRQR